MYLHGKYKKIKTTNIWMVCALSCRTTTESTHYYVKFKHNTYYIKLYFNNILTSKVSELTEYASENYQHFFWIIKDKITASNLGWISDW